MPLKTKYEKILEEQGIEAANAYMRQLASKVKKKNRRGLQDNPEAERKRISALGVAARQAKRGN